MSGEHEALVALLAERSLRRGQFTLASGRTSPFYVDARTTTMSARGLKLVGTLGLAAMRDAGWTAELVGGMTLGADPVAYAIALASLADPPAVDAFTVRKDAKTHGTARRLEGVFRAGARVVVVEDVITTGGSALAVAAAVDAAGGKVSGVLAVVDRDEGGREALAARGLALRAMVTLDEIAARLPV